MPVFFVGGEVPNTGAGSFVLASNALFSIVQTHAGTQ